VTQTPRYAPVSTMLLSLPDGITAGYANVTLVYLLSHAGVAADVIGGLVALNIAPNAWKFAWAPLMDKTLSSRVWIVFSLMITVGCFAGFAVLPITPASLPWLRVLIVAQSAAVSVATITVTRTISLVTPDHKRGAIGAWYNVGHVGGTGLGGGLGLWLAHQFPGSLWVAALAMAGLIAACGAGLLGFPNLPRDPGARTLGRTVIELGADGWRLARGRVGALALLLALLPVGSGAAGSFWAVVADDWHASANMVALVNGALSGLLTIPGCMIGGFLCDRMDRKGVYMLGGALMGLAALAMLVAPHDETGFVIWTSVYALVNGIAFTAFSAFVMEAIGVGAAGTKYALIASLSNLPIIFATLADGKATSLRGPRGLLLTEVALEVVGIGFFLMIAVLTARRRRVWPQAG